MTSIKTRTGAKSRGSGERYIQVRGSARYVIKAKTREEALEKARERFKRDITKGRKSFAKTGLPDRWKGLAGFEATRVRKGKEPKERELDLEWKNRPTQKQWFRGKRG